jgi:hypothetical protein
VRQQYELALPTHSEEHDHAVHHGIF